MFDRHALLCLVISAGSLGLAACVMPAELEPPTLTGGFTGVATCNDIERQLDLMLSQADPEDNDVEGNGFVEWNVLYVDGIFSVTIPHVVRGRLSDGDLDGDTFSGLMLSELADGRGNAPDFSFELDVEREGEAQSIRSLEGEWNQLDDNQEVVVTCDADLEPVGD